MINKLHSLYCCMLVLIVTFWSGIDTYATTVKMQQDQKVKGIVVDEKGEVIIGATIQVIDSQERTVTNIIHHSSFFEWASCSFIHWL